MVAPPFFSVVIPTYNRPDYLKEAVASVLAQTFLDYELIVVDDSPEATGRQVVQAFEDPRVSYVLNDHRSGGAGTRNAGIVRAKGEWVAFLDDDDIWLPQKLERQHEQITGLTDDVGLVYTGSIKFDENREEIATFVPKHEGWLHETLLSRNVIKGLYSVAVRRDILEAVGGLDESFPALQDMDLYVRVAERSKVAFIAEPLVRVRASGSGRITTNYVSKLRGSRLFWEKFRSDIDKDLRLKHRAASRVFMYAFAEGDAATLAKNAPLVLAGLVLDPDNILYVARFVARTVRVRLTRAA